MSGATIYHKQGQFRVSFLVWMEEDGRPCAKITRSDGQGGPLSDILVIPKFPVDITIDHAAQYSTVTITRLEEKKIG